MKYVIKRNWFWYLGLVILIYCTLYVNIAYISALLLTIYYSITLTLLSIKLYKMKRIASILKRELIDLL